MVKTHMTDHEWSFCAVKYHIGAIQNTPVHIEKRDNNWVVALGFGFVLSKSGEILHEPNPSSRTAEFIENTRFSHKYEAYACFVDELINNQ